MRIAIIVGLFSIAVAIDKSIFDNNTLAFAMCGTFVYCCLLDILYYFDNKNKRL